MQGKIIWGLQKTYNGMFRGGTKGGERDGLDGLGMNKHGKIEVKGIQGSGCM